MKPWSERHFFSLPARIRPQPQPAEQDPGKTPDRTIWTRSSRGTPGPSGLKENKVLTRLMKQPSIAWAIRSAGRHILD